MDLNSSSPYPEGVISFLDTDLYKLTMQCAVLKYFPRVQVTYAFHNRTPDMKFSRAAFRWFHLQIQKLGNIALSAEEYRFLSSTCTYLNISYLEFLKEFRLRPREQIVASFIPDGDTGGDDELGKIDIEVKGLWVETILYEIPLLALASEAYFRFMDTDWNYDGQENKAYEKGMRLFQNGCIFSEFGTRRRRDYHTQALVIRGLLKASRDGEKQGFSGKFSGSSNVHLAMRFGISPVGTVAHEWFMGIAAITDDYERASETALNYWVGCFGEGVLGVALTDTFGTSVFLNAFSKPVPSRTEDQPHALPQSGKENKTKTFAQVFTGVRQDSGDPATFVKTMRDFYNNQGILDSKTIVFSDSLNIDLCLEYKRISEVAGFQPTFGIGTFFTNDFVHLDTGHKSVPLNIVIKLSSAAGQPAIKISDNIGKNTGDPETLRKVKERLGYVEQEWNEGDETRRWGLGS